MLCGCRSKWWMSSWPQVERTPERRVSATLMLHCSLGLSCACSRPLLLRPVQCTLTSACTCHLLVLCELNLKVVDVDVGVTSHTHNFSTFDKCIYSLPCLLFSVYQSVYETTTWWAVLLLFSSCSCSCVKTASWIFDKTWVCTQSEAAVLCMTLLWYICCVDLAGLICHASGVCVIVKVWFVVESQCEWKSAERVWWSCKFTG